MKVLYSVVLCKVSFKVNKIEFCFELILQPNSQRSTGVTANKFVNLSFKQQKDMCKGFRSRKTSRLFHKSRTVDIRGLCNVSPARHELVTPPLTSGGQDNVPGQDMIQDFANNTLQKYETPLNCDSITQQTSAWLQSHRFSTYLHTFSGYSGADLLRLSRDDLIQICGLADGIRLFNALHTKTKTVYVCVQSSPSVYHALYLANLSSQEMATKIAVLLGITVSQIQNIFMMGPSGIHVVMSDDLVYNIKDGATYAVEMSQDPSSERKNILLKPTH
uniref:Uncharacterized protein n=1 Tax=Clastoptera arizonana TaxID=38151 RepID=A0A1B6CNI8_9HEMI